MKKKGPRLGAAGSLPRASTGLSPSTAMEAVHKTDEAVRMIDGRDNLTARLKICERSVRHIGSRRAIS